MEKLKIKRISEINQSLPIIINANWMNAIGIVRSLALEDIPSISITKDKFGLGLYSKQTIGLRCPDYQKYPHQFLQFMLDLSKHLKHPGIIMPTDDVILERLIQFDKELTPYYKRTYPEPKLLDLVLDKYNQYLSAQSIGLPVPYSIAPENESDLKNWPSELFPCVVKGRKGKYFYKFTGSQAIPAQNFDKLLKIFRQAGSIKVIIQEYIPGGDDQLFAYISYISNSDELITEYISQKTQQIPINFGVMRRGVSKYIPKLREQSQKLLRNLNFRGLSYIEYKRDIRDGRYKLIEINARFWKNNFMATLSGINFPYTIYLASVDKPVAKKRRQVDGVEWVSWIEEIFFMFGDLITKNTSIKKWFKGRPNGRDVILGWKDPLPAFIVPIYLLNDYFKNRIRFKKLFRRIWKSDSND